MAATAWVGSSEVAGDKIIPPHYGNGLRKKAARPDAHDGGWTVNPAASQPALEPELWLS